MRALTSIVLLMVPVAVMAQEPQPPGAQRPTLKVIGDYSGLTADDRNSYCLWAGQLYSIGASFCSRQQTLTTCTEVSGRRPAWVSKDNDKLCERNASFTPQ
jgi:hypothetical protein